MAKQKVETTKGTERVMNRAVCLSLELSKPGNRRKVQTEDVTVNADADMISVSKKLVDSAEYKAIVSLDGEMGAWLRRRSVPGLFRAGFCMVNISLIASTDAYLTKKKSRREELIASFAAAYPERVETAKLKLGYKSPTEPGLFNVTQYPPVERIVSAFRMKWFYLNFQTADSLAEVAPDLYEREKVKIAEAWQEAKQEGVNAITAGFADLVHNMAAKLSDPTKVFRDTLVGNFKEYLELFNSRIAAVSDGVDVQALREQVDNVRKLITNANPDTLREAVFYRKEIADQMTKVSKTVDSMMEDLPERRIRKGKKQEVDGKQ